MRLFRGYGVGGLGPEEEPNLPVARRGCMPVRSGDLRVPLQLRRTDCAGI